MQTRTNNPVLNGLKKKPKASRLSGLDSKKMLCIIVYLNSSELIKKLKTDGWHLVNVKVSHHQFKHESKEGKVTIKHPAKDIPLVTLRSIFRQAGWDWR